MGFPVGYTELFLPKVFLHLLSVLGFVRNIISTLFHYVGLQDFIEPNNEWIEQPIQLTKFNSMSALLIREILPVVKFSELVDPPECCAVCLYEFEAQDEIRRLTNCRHIFHMGCLDRWMGYDQRTCPLCRTSFIPQDMQDAFNDKLFAASRIPEFYGDYSHFTVNTGKRSEKTNTKSEN